VRNCTRDEGGPFEVGNQVLISSHRKLPQSRAAATRLTEPEPTPGTRKLTTRFFSVQIGGVQDQSSLFGFQPPKVRIEVRANKKCVSIPVSASYGFEDATGEVKLEIAKQDTAYFHIEIATSTVSGAASWTPTVEAH
jgi:hypothetical protein